MAFLLLKEIKFGFANFSIWKILFRIWTQTFSIYNFKNWLISKPLLACSVIINAAVFVEYFNIGTKSNPNNFVILNGEEIPFLSKTEFHVWQELKFEKVEAPGSSVIVRSRNPGLL